MPAYAGTHAEPFVIRCFGHSVRRFCPVSASVCYSRSWNSRSNSFVQAPSSGGCSNARRPAVSVPHLEVNAEGRRSTQAWSCKTIACRGRIPEILIVSSRLQRKDNLQNWHQFQTAVSCNCNFSNFAVANSRAIVLLDVRRAWAFVCFALTS